MAIGKSRTFRTWYGVQGHRVDSDLRGINAETMRIVKERLNMARAQSWQELDTLLKAQRRGNELYARMMIALLFVLLAEMFVELRFI